MRSGSDPRPPARSLATAAIVLVALTAAGCAWEGVRPATGNVIPVALSVSSDGYTTVVGVTLRIENTGTSTIYRSTVSLRFSTDLNTYAETVASDLVLPPGRKGFVTREFVLADAEETPPESHEEIEVVDAYFM